MLLACPQVAQLLLTFPLCVHFCCVQLKKVQLTAELDRLDALGHLTERDIPITAEDLR